MTDEQHSKDDNLVADTPNEGVISEDASGLENIDVTTDQKKEASGNTSEPGQEISSNPDAQESISATSNPVPEVKEAPQLDDLGAVLDNSKTPNTSAEENLTPLGGNVMSIKKIQNIKVNVQVMLGSVSLSISRLASLKKGELLSLDTAIGDPVEILANGQLIARGEIVVVGDETPKFGITLIEIIDSDIAAL